MCFLLQLSGQQLEVQSDLEYIHDLAYYQVCLIETIGIHTHISSKWAISWFKFGVKHFYNGAISTLWVKRSHFEENYISTPYNVGSVLWRLFSTLEVVQYIGG